MAIVLFYAPVACSLVPYVALVEAQASFEVRVVNFMKGEHLTPEFLRLNPKHKVPVLSIDGEPLTENVAILQWIDFRHPQATLLPAEGLRRFQVISFLAWCASGIHPFLTPNVLPQRYCDMPGSEDSVRRCAHKMLHEVFMQAESRLVGKEWFFDEFSAADIYFFWCFRRATLFNVDTSELANCRQHLQRMQARDSVKKLLAFEAECMRSA